jgi:alpha/beta superfamily hydrolase
MNNKVVYNLFQTFARRGFSVLRFNFRGVGRSQGRFDQGVGELSDAAAALNWVQSFKPNATECWIAGYSYGAWIGMQLLMRRPEITRFVSVAPPANLYDFNFLAPCPASGLILHGESDRVVPPGSVKKLVEKISLQRGITIDYRLIRDANHIFQEQIDEVIEHLDDYIATTLVEKPQPTNPRAVKSRAAHR